MAEVKISKKDLREMYENGSVADIAKKYGITPPTVYRLLDEAKIPRKGQRTTVLIDDENGDE